MSTTKKQNPAAAGDLESIGADLARLDAEEQADDDRTPVHRAEAMRRRDAMLEAHAARFELAVDLFTAPTDRGPHRVPYVPARAAVAAGVRLSPVELTFGILAHVVPDLVRANLTPAIDAVYRDSDGLTDEERTRRREERHRQRAALARAEERLLRAGDDLADPRRRWDADPAVVLEGNPVERLRTLARRVRGLHACVRDTEAELSEARTAYGRADGERGRVELRQHEPLPMRPDLAAHTARVEQLRVLVDQAAAAHATAVEAWRGPCRLLRACEEWVRARGLVGEDGLEPSADRIAVAAPPLDEREQLKHALGRAT